MITDRSEGKCFTACTNEELITDIFQSHINSYKDLPYHIQWKFRDEVSLGLSNGRKRILRRIIIHLILMKKRSKNLMTICLAYIKTFIRMGLHQFL